MLNGSCPASGETSYESSVGQLVPNLESNLPFKGIHLFLSEDWELLIGWRIDVELNTFALKHALHFHCHVDGMLSYVKIKIVGKERVELDAQEPALGKQGSMLLDDGEELTWSVALGEHHSLATQGANLGAANIEHITQASKSF